MRRLSFTTVKAGWRIHDAERRLIWTCFRIPLVMARCSEEEARKPSRSWAGPASASTAASARCADKDPWVRTTMSRAIVGCIELRINRKPVPYDRLGANPVKHSIPTAGVRLELILGVRRDANEHVDLCVVPNNSPNNYPKKKQSVGLARSGTVRTHRRFLKML